VQVARTWLPPVSQLRDLDLFGAGLGMFDSCSYEFVSCGISYAHDSVGICPSDRVFVHLQLLDLACNRNPLHVQIRWVCQKVELVQCFHVPHRVANM